MMLAPTSAPRLLGSMVALGLVSIVALYLLLLLLVQQQQEQQPPGSWLHQRDPLDYDSLFRRNVTFGIDTLSSDTAAAVTTSPSRPSEAAWQRADQARAAGVLCSKLLRGDRAEVARAAGAVAAGSQAFKRSASDDDERLANVTCSQLLAAGYARRQRPASELEAGFRLAFGIRFHRRSAQAELLLRTVYAPQNVYCLHVDPAAERIVHEGARRLASCLPNVHLAQPVEKRFVYGSASPVLADLACMRLLLAIGGATWRYFINLTGQELPLKTNYELVRLLMLYNGSNELESEPGSRYTWRYSRSFWCRDAANGETVRCPSPLVPKPPIPLQSTTVYKGLAYGYFSRAFVEFVVREGGMAAMLLSWFNDTYSPDENYWATLNRLPDAPGSYVGKESLQQASRAVSWIRVSPCQGQFVREVCVYGVGDLPRLLSRHEAFANKFSVDYDPIAAQCLAEHIADRAANEPHGADSWLVPWYWSEYLRLPQIQATRT